MAVGVPPDNRPIDSYLANRVERLQLEARALVSPRSAMMLSAQKSMPAASSSSGQSLAPGTPLAPVDPHSFFREDNPARQNVAQKVANLEKQTGFSLPKGDVT
eukprot:2586805-Karenia_brevis.AAC.1